MKNLLYKQSLRKKTSSTGGERKEIAQRNVRAHGQWYGGGCGSGSGRCWCGCYSVIGHWNEVYVTQIYYLF